MLPLRDDTIRLFIHVLAAAIWVGGQLTLARLVPTLRTLGEGAPSVVGKRFNRFAWPTFGVLLVTGVWNLAEIHIGDTTTEYQVTVFVKLLFVAMSGIATVLHLQAKSKAGMAVWGSLGGISSVVALFFGVWLRS